MKPAVLITGGAGFIGANLADRLLRDGHPVRVFDNLSRPGVDRNLNWLRSQHGAGLIVDIADVRDRYALREAVAGVEQVYHLAAQVAVTTSLSDPVADFEINARGTLNLLEELRGLSEPPSVVLTSTNKVYGELSDIQLEKRGRRYQPKDRAHREYGIGERRSLTFHSPYGCSKGTADQYVLDYGRVFGMRTAVFRMSCIYGPHQFGTEDQGWVAHFLIRAMRGESITIFGDGMQVRDVLYVEDLVDALILAQQNIASLSGRAFNIGGGPANTVSLLELIDIVAELRGERPRVRFEQWRPADQRYYVSDTRAFAAATGWFARTSVREGAESIYRWLLESHSASHALATRLAS